MLEQSTIAVETVVGGVRSILGGAETVVNVGTVGGPC